MGIYRISEIYIERKEEKKKDKKEKKGSPLMNPIGKKGLVMVCIFRWGDAYYFVCRPQACMSRRHGSFDGRSVILRRRSKSIHDTLVRQPRRRSVGGVPTYIVVCICIPGDMDYIDLGIDINTDTST